MKRDFYDVLEVTSTVDAAGLKAAYRRLARQYHPDVTGGDKAKEERFKEIGLAYAILADPEKRAAYDGSRPGAGGVKGAQSSIFGPLFDELLSRVNAEGVGTHNLDSLLKDFMGVAADVQRRVPEKARKASESPGSLLGLVEEIFGTKIEFYRRDD